MARSGSVDEPSDDPPATESVPRDAVFLNAKAAELQDQLGVDLRTASRIAWRPAIILTRGDKSAAEDLVQQAFVNLFAALNAGTLHIRSNPTAYLHKVIRSVFYSKERRPATRSGNDVLIDDMQIFDNVLREHEQENPEAVAELTALKDLIVGAISSMNFPDDRRRILNLLVTGYSVKDISEILGIPASTVRSRILAIRKDVRNAFRRAGWEVD